MRHADHHKIYILGASGSGTTTLGARTAAMLDLVHVDCDDHYWAPIDPPFSVKQPSKQRVASMRTALGSAGWVLTGSCNAWGQELVSQATFIVFVTLPTPVRLARLRAREGARFGHRIEEGGDMFGIHQGFMSWAQGYDDPTFEGRNIAAHESWLAAQTRPVFRVENAGPPQDTVNAVIKALKQVA